MTTNLFRTEEERKVTLAEREVEEILKVDPSFQSLSGSIYFDNYDLPCPVLVEVVKKDGTKTNVVLRVFRHGDSADEVKIFRALEEYGLPVPKILKEPFQNEKGDYAAVYSFLSGMNLQKLSMESNEKLEEAKNLLIVAVDQLTRATEFIAQHAVSSVIPRRTLIDELEFIKNSNNPWLKEKLFQEAVQHLEQLLSTINTPLVFTNSDYQPGNFLAENGKIVGFLDFERPLFEDPLMGFVKYPIYDMIPLSRTNLIEVFLSTHGFSEADFRPRLALGCLKTLIKEIPISGGDTEMQEYRDRVLKLLKQSLS